MRAAAIGWALVIWVGAAGAAWAQGGLGIDPRELFLELDANNDTVIDREEVPEAGRAAFDKLLKIADLDKNGRLELSELRALGEKLRAVGPLGGMGLLQRFDAIDKNGDGKISREEFPGLPAGFERLDANKDGFITRAEAADGPRQAVAAFLERFKVMDKNGDGKVSREEYQGPPPLFDRLDADKDGFITKEEAAKLGGPASENKDAKPAPKPKEEKEKPAPAPASAKSSDGELGPRFKAMDKDGDGKISRAEFQGREAAFNRLDANKDGFITKDETPNLRDLGGGQRFKALDKNGDGKLSREEFPGRPAMFDRLDTDKDGFLSREEAAKMRELIGGAAAKKP